MKDEWAPGTGIIILLLIAIASKLGVFAEVDWFGLILVAVVIGVFSVLYAIVMWLRDWWTFLPERTAFFGGLLAMIATIIGFWLFVHPANWPIILMVGFGIIVLVYALSVWLASDALAERMAPAIKARDALHQRILGLPLRIRLLGFILTLVVLFGVPYIAALLFLGLS
jgi:hypothetical protein